MQNNLDLSQKYTHQFSHIKLDFLRYDAEQFGRREAEDQLTQLRQKHDFNSQVSSQEKHDLSDRLNRASSTIVNLETKVCQN